jgi:hypothetical protein
VTIPAQIGSRHVWDLWEKWSAPVETVAQIARAGIWALHDSGVPEPTCRIDVYAEGDVETFGSPTDFLNEVTPDAVRKCDGMVICVGNERETILAKTTIVVRGDRVALRSNTGVLLELTAFTSEADQKLPEIRRRLRASIERRKHTSKRISDGTGVSPGEFYKQHVKRPGADHFPWKTCTALGIVWGILLIVVPPLRTAFAPLVGFAVEPNIDDLVTGKPASPIEASPMELITSYPALAVGLLIAGITFSLLMAYPSYSVAKNSPPYVHEPPSVRVFTSRIVPIWRKGAKMMFGAFVSLLVGLVSAYIVSELGLKK